MAAINTPKITSQGKLPHYAEVSSIIIFIIFNCQHLKGYDMAGAVTETKAQSTNDTNDTVVQEEAKKKTEAQQEQGFLHKVQEAANNGLQAWGNAAEDVRNAFLPDQVDSALEAGSNKVGQFVDSPASLGLTATFPGAGAWDDLTKAAGVVLTTLGASGLIVNVFEAEVKVGDENDKGEVWNGKEYVQPKKLNPNEGLPDKWNPSSPKSEVKTYPNTAGVQDRNTGPGGQVYTGQKHWQ
jgi:hypothetical protein